MNDNTLLTIGIPTYNGGCYIEQTINSIFTEIKKNNLVNVEILISDNCSNDNTSKIIEELKINSTLEFNYYQHKNNLGFDRNVDSVVRMSKGKYVWIMADDDYVVNDGIKKVLDFLNKHELALLFLNYDNPITISDRTLVCENGNDFFRNTKFKSGQISSNVINKELWCSLDMERYFDSQWIHLAYAVEALSPLRNKKAGIIGDKILIADGITRWGGGGSFIYTGFKLLDIFKNMPGLHYDKDIKKIADFVIKDGYPYYLLIAKAQGLVIDKKLIEKFKYYYSDYLSFWIVDLPVLYLPNSLCVFIFKYAYMAKKFIKSIRNTHKNNKRLNLEQHAL